MAIRDVADPLPKKLQRSCCRRHQTSFQALRYGLLPSGHSNRFPLFDFSHRNRDCVQLVLFRARHDGDWDKWMVAWRTSQTFLRFQLLATRKVFLGQPGRFKSRLNEVLIGKLKSLSNLSMGALPTSSSFNSFSKLSGKCV